MFSFVNWLKKMSEQKIYFYHDPDQQDGNTFHVHRRTRPSKSKKSPRLGDDAGPSFNLDNNESSQRRRKSKSKNNEENPPELEQDLQDLKRKPRAAELLPPLNLIIPLKSEESAVENDVNVAETKLPDLNENENAIIKDSDNDEEFNTDELKEDQKTKQIIQEMFIYFFFLIICFTIVFWMSSSSAFFLTNAMTKGFMETPFIKLENVSLPVMPVFPTEAPIVTTKKPSSKTTTTKKPKKKTTTKKSSGKKRTTPAGFLRIDNHEPEYDDENDENDEYDEYEEEEFFARRSLDNEKKNTSDGIEGGTENVPQILKNSLTLEDFWDFTETTLMNLLYWDFWYSYKNPIKHTEKDDQLIFYSSLLLGVARIRQLRVRSDSCTIHPQFAQLFKSCYGFYSSSAEFVENFMPVNPVIETRDAWFYTPADDLKTLTYNGIFGSYGRGGYVMDMALDRDTSRLRIQELKNNLWIDRATRAVIVDFTIYNPNVNLFVVSKIVVEMPPTGGIYPMSNFYALKFLRYVSTGDYIVLGFEILYIFFILYYTLVAVFEILGQKLKYLQNGWNILDLVILIIGYICIFWGFYRYFVIEPMVTELMESKTKHPEFDLARSVQHGFDQTCAIFAFFVFLKIFRFLHFTKTVDKLNKTISKSMKSILTLGAIFLIFQIGFALMAYLIFGTRVYEYRTVWSSTMTLFQAIIGKFNYRTMEEADYVFGPLFFILFVFFVFFILMNIFVAIMIDSYKMVQSEVHSIDEKNIPHYLKQAAVKIFPCLAPKTKTDTTIDKIKDNLKRAGFTDTEISIFFAKYDINLNKAIDEQDAKNLINKLELREYDFEPIGAKNLTELQKEVERLNEIVEKMAKEKI